MTTILITGASRGLGLAIARALDARGGADLVLAVRDPAAMARRLPGFRRPPRVVALDMAALGAVRRFAAIWDGPLDAVVHNAGLQNVGTTLLSPDGVEVTLAVNHLGPLALTRALLPRLAGGRVLLIGSGTHNPDNRTARLFGFRGGRFTTIADLARGETDAGASDRRKGADRYATSKLLAMTAQVELARRHPDTRFLTLDPGLMPGTGLARTAPAPQRLLWATALRALVPVIPGASTPARSAEAAATLLGASWARSGEIYDHRARPSAEVWERVRDPEFGRIVLDQSLAFLERLPAVA